MAQSILNSLMEAVANGGLSVIDLSHSLGPDTPILELPEPFSNTPAVARFSISNFDEKGPYWTWNYYTLGEHTGTHFDAPGHWISGREFPDGTTDTIAASRFIAPASVIDCSEAAERNPDFTMTADMIRQWEKQHASIAGTWLLMRTDWAKRVNDPKAFLNADGTGPHSPGPSVDAVKYMIERDVCGFGCETVGTDAGQAGSFEIPFPAHTLFHGANKFGMASLNNLDQLPAVGTVVITSPLNFAKGSGSPLRPLALVAK